MYTHIYIHTRVFIKRNTHTHLHARIVSRLCE